MKANGKARGRPRKFDQNISLNGAVKLFKSKGYSATSLDDLANAMGINRPSMYNAFGNKASIYAKAIEHYFNQLASPLEIALAHICKEKAFEDFFSLLLDFYCEDNLGCLATSTMPVESIENNDIREFYKEITNKIDLLILARLKLSNTSEYSLLTAQLLQALMQTLSLRARGGIPRSELETLYRFGLKTILVEKV